MHVATESTSVAAAPPAQSSLTETVLSLWEKGQSAGEIARELHVTRNVVMGRVHRAQTRGIAERRKQAIRIRRALTPLEVQQRKEASRVRWIRYKERHGLRIAAPKPPPPPPPAPLEAVIPLDFHIMPLPSLDAVRWHASDGCCWLDGEPADMHWCNRPQLAGSSYCPAHAAMVLA